MEQKTKNNIAEVVRYLAIGIATTALVISLNEKIGSYISPQQEKQNYSQYHK